MIARPGMKRRACRHLRIVACLALVLAVSGISPAITSDAAAQRVTAQHAARPGVLAVRSGQHNGFGRLVFDWRSVVNYRVKRNGPTINIEFDRTAGADVSELRDDLPDHVFAAAAQPTARGLRIALLVPDDARIRHYRDGTSIILDIVANLPAASRASRATPPPRPARTVRARPAPVAKKKKKKDSGAVSGRPPRLTPDPRNHPATKGNGPGIKGKGPVRLVHSKSRRAPTGGLVSVEVTGTGSKIFVRFNWRKKVAAAMYRRQGNVWIFFDEAARVDLGGIRYLGRKLVSEAKQYPLRDAALIRLAIRPEVPVTAGHDGQFWTLEIGASAATGSRPRGIPVQTEIDSRSRTSIVLPVDGPVKHYRLRDPEVGDIIDIVPVGTPGQGVRKARRFVEFELYASYQGIAIRPISDGISVRTGKGGVVIASARGLAVSSPRNIARGNTNIAADRPLANIEAWRRGTRSEFDKIKDQLIRRVVALPRKKRTKARIDLIKFYLAHRMAAEASGVLQVIAREDAAASRTVKFRALRGATNYLLAHFGDASADFAMETLRQARTVWPWLAGLAAEKGNWRAAYNLFESTDAVIAGHPDWLTVHFKMLSIEAALTVGDLKKAERQLKTVAQAEASEQQRAYIKFLGAFLMRKKGKRDQAVKIWTALAASPHRKARARATFALIDAQLEQKKISPEKAIERLEALAFAWRGGAFEFDLLQRLGDLYATRHDYRRALQRYRKAASYFEKVKGAKGVAQKMSETFKKLYLEGAADKLPSVTALALFEEFRELTPAGVPGDEMIRKLADRLAKVDLLNEAAALLTNQVEYRLKGTDKARVAARVALIRLLDHKPKLALKALVSSEESDLPADLARQRRHLKARAHAELGRSTEALEALGDEEGEEVRSLRLGIYWRASKWSEAALILGDILAERRVAADDDEATRFVLQRAVALALAHDDSGLQGLRNRYTDIMAKSRHAKAFSAIAGKQPENVSDFKSLVTHAGNLDAFQSFMASYRERMRTADLSAIN